MSDLPEISAYFGSEVKAQRHDSGAINSIMQLLLSTYWHQLNDLIFPVVIFLSKYTTWRWYLDIFCYGEGVCLLYWKLFWSQKANWNSRVGISLICVKTKYAVLWFGPLDCCRFTLKLENTILCPQARKEQVPPRVALQHEDLTCTFLFLV